MRKKHLRTAAEEREADKRIHRLIEECHAEDKARWHDDVKARTEEVTARRKRRVDKG